MSNICYAPLKGVDDKIAEHLGYNPEDKSFKGAMHYVATLRGLYDESMEQKGEALLDTSDPERAAAILKNYKKESSKERFKSLDRHEGDILVSSYKKLKKSISGRGGKRRNRVNVICYLTSKVIDSYVADAGSRERVLNGYTGKDGKPAGGVFRVLEKVYEILLQRHAYFMAESQKEGISDKEKAMRLEQARQIRLMFDNWAPLVTYARLKLRITEGQKIGNKLEWAEEIDPSNFGNNDIEALLPTQEHSHKEHWMVSNDLQSAFGSIGKHTRSLLGRCRLFENGKLQYDDLGFAILMDPVRAHQKLQKLLRGVKTEKQLMTKLQKNSYDKQKGQMVLKPKYAWLTDIVNYLDQNDVAKTEFLNDFVKNFQIYTCLVQDKSEGAFGLKRFFVKTLNRQENILEGKYLSDALMGHPINPETTIYDAVGNINWKNLYTLREEIGKWMWADPKNPLTSKALWDNATMEKRAEWIVEISERLGIDVDIDTAEAILSSTSDTKKFKEELKQLYSHGLKYSNLESMANADVESVFKNGGKNMDSLPTRSFFSLLQQSKDDSEGPFREHLNKLLTVIAQNQEASMYESSTLYKDSKGRYVTYYSDVNPCFMGDKIEEIQGYVQEDDHKGLRDFLEEHYLKSSYFFDKKNNEILNKWLEELYNATLDSSIPLSKNMFASSFAFLRALGESGNEFENFTDRKHMIDMLTRFVSGKYNKKEKKRETAWYSVFVLGDSNVSKYIQAKVYSKDEILKGLYNVYRQEQARWKLQDAATKEYGTIQNFSQRKLERRNTADGYEIVGGEFTMLPFLNEDFKAPDGSVGKYYRKLQEGDQGMADVMEVIKDYMDDAFEVFKKDIGKMKFQKKNGKYIDLPEAYNTSEDKVWELFKDFYWNHKFATVQQLQFLTVDPAFYGLGYDKVLEKVFGTTKDLQKRFKQEHAPGRPPSLLAVNPFTKERYSEDGIERVAYFADIEIDGEKANPDFMEVVAQYYKPGTKEYDDYKESSLTDGQGFRTLKSYRKVMGMLSKWSPEMENAYNRIQELKQQYPDELPKEALAEIARLAVVFQPVKPILFGMERLAVGDDVLYVPTQHKYAEAVIIPELLSKDNKLRHLAEWMDDETKAGGAVDMVCSTKAVKVGIFGQTDISQAKTSEDFRAAMDNAYIHQFSYSNYREQSNVPNHIQEKRLYGTQIRKIIMSGIDMAKSYGSYIGGMKVKIAGIDPHNEDMVELTGRNLVSFYNSLIMAQMKDSLDGFLEQTGDIETLSNALVQNIINNSREAEDNILAVTIENFIEEGELRKEFGLPLHEAGIEHDTAALLLSMFKKQVNKQTIMGNSLVQVSALGIKDFAEDVDGDGGLKYRTRDDKLVDASGVRDLKNIKWAETEIPWDLVYKAAKNQNIELRWEDFCHADGSLIMTEEVNEEGDQIAAIEKILPGVLDMVAYRIPTEREYSMMRLRVVRFSNPIAGGTIKVPALATKVAGFDFDIDKLYLIRKEFKTRKLTDSEVKNLWEDFYKDNKDIKAALQKAREQGEKEDGLQGAISEFMRDTFFHSETASQIADVEGGQTEVKNRLWKWWEEAGLEGTPQEALQEYISQHPEKWLKFEDYDFNKTAQDNTPAARNNMLLQLTLKRLEDPETLRARVTPGGFKQASAAARAMRELLFGDILGLKVNGKIDLERLFARTDRTTDPEPEFDPTDPMTIIRYNQQNQVAGKLIGIFANHNTNHAFASLMHTFELANPIAFAGHSYKDLKNAPNGIDVARNMAELLAASVDAVKDPVLNFLNFNSITADMGATLIRLGYTMSEVGMLLNQPIIKYISEECANRDVSTNIVIEEICAAKKIYLSEVKTSASDFTMEKLAENIIAGREFDTSDESIGKSILDNSAIMKEQTKVLALFSQIAEVTNEVSQFVTNTKFTASNAVPSTFGGLFQQMQRVDKYVELCKDSKVLNIKVSESNNLPIDNREELLSMSEEEYWQFLITNPFGYEQFMYDANRKMLRHLSRYFPYLNPMYSSVRNNLISLTSSKTLDEGTINSIHSELMVYLLSTREGSDFDGEQIKEGTDYTVRDYYTKYFVKDLLQYIHENPSIKKNPLFQYMTPTVNKKTGNIGIRIGNIGGLHESNINELKEAWEELYEENKDLAMDLFLYNFYQKGFNYSYSTFLNLAPVSLKQDIKVGFVDGKEMSYLEMLQKMLDPNSIFSSNSLINVIDFSIQYLLNHSDNTRLVYQAEKSSLANKLMQNKYKQGTTVANVIEIDSSEDNANAFVQNTVKEDDITVTTFRPAFLYKDAVYIAMGSDSNSPLDSTTIGTKMTYKRFAIGERESTLIYRKPIQEGQETIQSRASKGSEWNSNLESEPISELPEGAGTSDSVEGTIDDPATPGSTGNSETGFIDQYYEKNPQAQQFNSEMAALSIAYAIQKGYKNQNGTRASNREDAMRAIKQSNATEDFKQYARSQYELYDLQNTYDELLQKVNDLATIHITDKLNREDNSSDIKKFFNKVSSELEVFMESYEVNAQDYYDADNLKQTITKLESVIRQLESQNTSQKQAVHNQKFNEWKRDRKGSKNNIETSTNEGNGNRGLGITTEQVDTPTYSIGTRINHSTFGNGIVIRNQMVGGDEITFVKFDNPSIDIRGIMPTHSSRHITVLEELSQQDYKRNILDSTSYNNRTFKDDTINVAKRRGDIAQEVSGESLIEAIIDNMDVTAFNDMIDAIRQGQRNSEGLLVLDENGEVKPMCKR